MGPMKAERRAPVVHDQRDVALEPERVEPAVEVACVIDEAIERPSGVRPEAPIPTKSGARQRPSPERCGITLSRQI